MDYLFFGGLISYFAAVMLYFVGIVFKREALKKAGWYVFLLGAALSGAYLVARGVKAGRLPMSNQFEFAASFSFGISLLLLILHYRFHADWIDTVGIVSALMILGYAALQPREITDLMPALRSVWFGLHIGTAALSYAAFMLAGGAGLRYLLIHKKNAEDERLEQVDFFTYRLIAFGFLLLTITIIIGMIWAEEAWSAFWTWDPKETWALITWILYAVYLHLRLMMKKNGVLMAWYAIISVPVVLFTFIGVNTLLPGLHSYGAVMTSALL